MSTKIDELFATLRGLVADQPRDLAMAMDERDAAKLAHSQLLREYDEECSETDIEIRELKAANARLAGVNARLVTDLADAMARIEHAEAIASDV